MLGSPVSAAPVSNALPPNPVRSGLPPITPETRAIVARINHRRLVLQGDNQLMRSRYEEVMRWVNPPWDPVSRRLDPRGETATAARLGENILHADITNPVIDRWAVLQLGAPPVYRVQPKYVRPPVDQPSDPAASAYERNQYNFDSAIAQAQASQMEQQTQLWAEAANLPRTLLWAAWCKEAFGKAIIKTGWDPDDKIPTAELFENPSAVYYGWTKRYGTRKIAWAMVVDELDPAEANRRFGLSLPEDENGNIDFATWTGLADQGDMDQRPEQTGAVRRYITVEESWEIARKPYVPPVIDAETGETLWSDPDDGKMGVMFALVLAGRVIEGPTWYPWKRVPFHVLENQHVPTWPHGKSMAESVIALNAALDDALDREHDVIQFESGPRFKGLNMANSGDEVDMPPPFHLLPLREGEDIAQIDTRVDFFPSSTHMQAIYESIHRTTGLTPIAWGMSPRAQTSGRSMSAEWRAVELPLTGKLINISPEVRDIAFSWWDYAEEYLPEMKKVAQGYRRITVLWVPLDIRDKTERSADIINRLNANLIDPETAIQESGYENVTEIRAKIQRYLTDPVWNPLRYQQLLTLQQLELSIRQQQLQVAQQEQQAQQQGAVGPGQPDQQGGAQPNPDQLAQQGAVLAGQAGQVGTAATPAQNQPGQAPGAGLLPLDTSILSQTPLAGGIGDRIVVSSPHTSGLGQGGVAPAGAPATTAGVAPR